MHPHAARDRLRFIIAKTAAVLLLLLAGCAAAVPVQPAQLQALASPLDDLQVRNPVEIRLSTGYTRTVPAARWRAVGRLPQGVVYRPLDTVFAIEGRQVHEAHLVIDAGRVQGFYLPGEGNFSPLAATVSINEGERR